MSFRDSIRSLAIVWACLRAPPWYVPSLTIRTRSPRDSYRCRACVAFQLPVSGWSCPWLERPERKGPQLQTASPRIRLCERFRWLSALSSPTNSRVKGPGKYWCVSARSLPYLWALAGCAHELAASPWKRSSGPFFPKPGDAMNRWIFLKPAKRKPWVNYTIPDIQYLKPTSPGSFLRCALSSLVRWLGS